jgi:hypothetical protein
VSALCDAANVMAGDVPQDTILPAFGIKHISTVSTARQDAQASFDLVTSRVQVTAKANDYPAIEQLLRAAGKACRYHRGTLAGFAVASVVRDAEGPDLENGDAGIYSRSVDFKVTFEDPM